MISGYSPLYDTMMIVASSSCICLLRCCIIVLQHSYIIVRPSYICKEHLCFHTFVLLQSPKKKVLVQKCWISIFKIKNFRLGEKAFALARQEGAPLKSKVDANMTTQLKYWIVCRGWIHIWKIALTCQLIALKSSHSRKHDNSGALDWQSEGDSGYMLFLRTRVEEEWQLGQRPQMTKLTPTWQIPALSQARANFPDQYWLPVIPSKNCTQIVIWIL